MIQLQSNLYLTIASGDDRNILKVYVAGGESPPPRSGKLEIHFLV